ncbi:hypothetical protein I3843_14G046500 [Carya illinoinensis]|nr:hypothetical protein I3843_14G046500 [Carya illinoinensis]
MERTLYDSDFPEKGCRLKNSFDCVGHAGLHINNLHHFLKMTCTNQNRRLSSSSSMKQVSSKTTSTW